MADNAGNSIARLIVVPKSRIGVQAAYHIVSNIAASKGLDGKPNAAHRMMPAWRPLAGNAVFVRAAMIHGKAIVPHADNFQGSDGNGQKKSRLCSVINCCAGSCFLMMNRLAWLDLALLVKLNEALYDRKKTVYVAGQLCLW